MPLHRSSGAIAAPALTQITAVDAGVRTKLRNINNIVTVPSCTLMGTNCISRPKAQAKWQRPQTNLVNDLGDGKLVNVELGL